VKTRILVTTDGSTLAERAAPVAIALAHALGATVEVLCVADESSAQTAENHDAEHALAIAQQRADTLARTIREDGLAVTATAVSGDPAEAIVRFAEARGVRLVVLATHGRGGVGRWLQGSVAEAVVRRSSIPVVLVRARENGAAVQPPGWTPTIVVPLDGSELGETALRPARRLAETAGGRLLLVQAIDVAIAASAAGVPGVEADVELLLDAEREAAEEYLARQAETLREEVAVETAVRIGPPADAIAELARERQASLVVMATHGRGGPLDRLIGSTIERVVRFGPCPVAVISPDAALSPAGAN